MGMSPREGAEALARYRAAAPAAITRGLRRALRRAEALVKTKYMERMDNRGSRFQPANPPPGPLGIRSGKLVRTVKVTEIRLEPGKVIGGLAAGDSSVRYARIHERGGVAGRVRIMARPYLRPALLDPETKIEEEVRLELKKLALATLRGLVRPA